MDGSLSRTPQPGKVRGDSSAHTAGVAPRSEKQKPESQEPRLLRLWGRAGDVCRMKLLFFLRDVGERLRAAGRSPVGPVGKQRPWDSGAGQGGEGPARRAPLGPASASREAAWRPAPPRHRSRPTFKSKWLKPWALGGRRDPLSPKPGPRAVIPTETREFGGLAGTPCTPGQA